MTQTNRPTSITVIAWIWIVTSALSGFSLPISMLSSTSRKVMEATGQPLIIIVLLSVLGIAVTLSCAIALLKGLSWGRSVFLVYSPIALLLTMVLYGFQGFQLPLLGGVLYYGVVAFFLTRPIVSAYFQNPSEFVAERKLSANVAGQIVIRIVGALVIYVAGRLALAESPSYLRTSVSIALLKIPASLWVLSGLGMVLLKDWGRKCSLIGNCW